MLFSPDEEKGHNAQGYNAHKENAIVPKAVMLTKKKFIVPKAVRPTKKRP